MLENQLFTVVKAALDAGFAVVAGFTDVEVQQVYQPSTFGVPSDPTVFMQTVIAGRRVGWVKREEIQPVAPATDFTHRETQWWETTLQIGALARHNPTDPDYLTLPTAGDIAKRASDILQSDNGMAVLKAGGVSPLRITNVRNVQIVNDSDQYEANPSFDIVLSYVQVIDSTTPPATEIVPVFGRV